MIDTVHPPLTVTSRRHVLPLLAGVAAVLAGGARAQDAAPALPAATEAIAPFRVAIPQAALDDLHHRLASTRWPEKETVADWSQGVPLAKAKALVAHLA